MQVALGVQDLPRASQFYTILLGSPPAASFDPPGLVFFDLDGVRLLLDRNAPASLIYLQVEDLTGTLEHLREHAQILSPRTASSSTKTTPSGQPDAKNGRRSSPTPKATPSD